MLAALLYGIGFGVILTIVPGPIFFGLIQTSIQKGFKYGWMFAAGVATSDLICIVFTYYGISSFLEDKKVGEIIAVSGGTLICIIGLFYFFKPPETTVPLNPIQKENKKGNFLLKGFLLNILNPLALFYWVGIVGMVSVKYNNDQLMIFSFFGAVVLTILFVDFLKSYIANRIKGIFTNKLLTNLNKGLGILLFGAGVKLLLDVYMGASLI